MAPCLEVVLWATARMAHHQETVSRARVTGVPLEEAWVVLEGKRLLMEPYKS